MPDALLEAEDLVRDYHAHDGRGHLVRAVNGVSLRVRHGEAVAVVGSSGAGKSTLARLLLALERPDRGRVLFDGHAVSHLPERKVRPLRRRFQPVFQDPIGSLNPRLKVGVIVAEALVAHGLGDRSERRARVGDLLTSVGLPADAASRYPGAFSGGERQRIAIARALASGPDLLILDEPLSALDVSTQAQILALLRRLRERLSLSLVVVAHDLALVRALCERVAVMAAGAIVEEGDTAAVLSRPTHSFTRALLAASPAHPRREDVGA